MNLFECMMRNSTCYKGTTKGTPVGVLWHDTGAGNKTLKRYVQPYEGDANYDELIAKLGKNTNKNDWNHITREAGLNAWIGTLADGSVATAQTMPWDYMPWGCGRGSKGSCNGDANSADKRFWLQFECCDDGYKDKAYFDKVYKEACEFTAYICKMFNIDPNGTVEYNGVKVPTILCHADAYKLGLGSNHADVYPWFNKFGKSMETARADVAKLMGIGVTTTKATYRVRKDWKDAASQVGAYSNLENAKKACDKAGAGYKVYDASGKVIYPVAATTTTTTTTTTTATVTTTSNFKKGDAVKLVSGAKWSSGKTVPNWVMKSKLYVRQINSDGTIVVSTLKIGPVTGTVDKKYVAAYSTSTASTATTTSKPATTTTTTSAAKFKVGDTVKLVSGAVYSSGKTIPAWVKRSKLYVRQINSDGTIVISVLKSGAVTGTVASKYLTSY